MLKTPYHLILGSQSPRRKKLLAGLDLPFDIRVIETEENFPAEMPVEEVAVYLAKIKGEAHLSQLAQNELVLTSDTVVISDNQILGKPKSREEALKMLTLLSGKAHEVVTGVHLLTLEKSISFSDTTKVFFKKMDAEEIVYYVDKYKPFDKAGSYGIQEWIGYALIEKIEGSYFNVMGLPVARLYDELKKLTE